MSARNTLAAKAERRAARAAVVPLPAVARTFATCSGCGNSGRLVDNEHDLCTECWGYLMALKAKAARS